MIVGFNTDIKHRGKVYHAQTEDHGAGNPLIETLVYIGGDILDSVQTRYADMVAGDPDEAVIVQMMENQHRRVIQLIKSDHYLSDEEKAKVAAEQEEKLKVIGAITENERAFDELVADWLEHEMVQEEVELIMRTSGDLVAGRPVELSLKASKNISRGMVAGARLTIKFISTVAEPQVIFEGETDRMGECLVQLSLPALDGGNGAIIVKCESDLGTSELRQLVKRAA